MTPNPESTPAATVATSTPSLRCVLLRSESQCSWAVSRILRLLCIACFPILELIWRRDVQFHAEVTTGSVNAPWEYESEADEVALGVQCYAMIAGPARFRDTVYRVHQEKGSIGTIALQLFPSIGRLSIRVLNISEHILF